MQMLLNGAVITADLQDSLSRAVIISLFSWRRADESDSIDPQVSKQGWWGDSYSEDKIGSKLWQLLRSELNNETLAKAEEYSYSALQWMIEDELVSDIEITASRNQDDFNRLDLKVVLISDVKTVYEFKAI